MVPPSRHRLPREGRVRSRVCSCRPNQSPDNTHVVERDHVIADGLTLLMTLARHGEHITSPEIAERLANRPRAIAHLAAIGAAGQHGSANDSRILAARIVVG